MAKSGTRKRTKTLTVRPPERISEMITEIREARGYESDSSVVFTGIRELHARVFPAYTIKKSSKADDSEESGSGIGIQICNALGGRVVERDGGKQVCVFYNFHKKRALKQEVPLSQMSDALIRNQYYPNREDVEKLRKDGGTDYKVEELTY